MVLIFFIGIVCLLHLPDTTHSAPPPVRRLDSYTANEVMRVVKGIVVEGSMTIAATIHSPSSHCYSLFDRVLILVDGGVVFDGPTGEQIW